MYSCKDVNRLLVDYLEKKMPEDVRKEMDYHLSLCPNCIRYVETYRKTIALTGTLKVDRMPADLEKTLLKILSRKQP